MKYIAVTLIAGLVYLAITRHATLPAAANAAASPTPGTDFLKAPLDRTHEVLQQARVRANDPALQ